MPSALDRTALPLGSRVLSEVKAAAILSVPDLDMPTLAQMAS